MTKHTPAPWHLSRTGTTVNAGAIEISQRRSPNKDRTRANARLIAAAPELLRDLVEATSWLAGIGNWDGERDRDLRRFADTIRRAQGAREDN